MGHSASTESRRRRQSSRTLVFSSHLPAFGMEFATRLFHAAGQASERRPSRDPRRAGIGFPNGSCPTDTTQQQGQDSMKRRDFLKVTGIGAAGAATLAAPAIAQSMPEIKWRLTASWPKSLDTLWGAVEVMAKHVADATDNKFQIQTFAGGEIVPVLQGREAVQNGTVEM